jgi:hypothetical protein
VRGPPSNSFSFAPATAGSMSVQSRSQGIQARSSKRADRDIVRSRACTGVRAVRKSGGPSAPIVAFKQHRVIANKYLLAFGGAGTVGYLE